MQTEDMTLSHETLSDDLSDLSDGDRDYIGTLELKDNWPSLITVDMVKEFHQEWSNILIGDGDEEDQVDSRYQLSYDLAIKYGLGVSTSE